MALQRHQIGPGGVQSGGEPGWTRADDDNLIVLFLRHLTSLFLYCGHYNYTPISGDAVGQFPSLQAGTEVIYGSLGHSLPGLAGTTAQMRGNDYVVQR